MGRDCPVDARRFRADAARLRADHCARRVGRPGLQRARDPLHDPVQRRAGLRRRHRASRPQLGRGAARRQRLGAARLPAGPLPADRLPPRLGRRQGRLRRGSQPRPAGLCGDVLHGPRLRQLLRHRRLARRRPDRLREGLDPPRRRSLRGPRHADPRRPARRPQPRAAAQDRGHRRLLRRRGQLPAGGVEGPGRASERNLHSLAQPAGQADEDRRGAAAVGLVGPLQRAAAERQHPRLPGPQPLRRPDRGREAVLPVAALRPRAVVGLLRTARRRPERRHHGLVQSHQPGRALRRRRRTTC